MKRKDEKKKKVPIAHDTRQNFEKCKNKRVDDDVVG